jgi:hypothetical protein
MCKYIIPWIGNCTKPVAGGEDYCEEHKGLKCVSCGAQATYGCGETGGFVCGQPLCDDCEHTIHENGTNGMGGSSKPPPGYGSHCRKENQVYTVWYERDQASDSPKIRDCERCIELFNGRQRPAVFARRENRTGTWSRLCRECAETCWNKLCGISNFKDEFMQVGPAE